MADCHCSGATPVPSLPTKGRSKIGQIGLTGGKHLNDWRLHSVTSRDTRCVRISSRCQANELISMLDCWILSTRRRPTRPASPRYRRQKNSVPNALSSIAIDDSIFLRTASYASRCRVSFLRSSLRIGPSVTDRYGRPCIAAPAIARPVYFSVSHTEGCVACAVSDCEAVGIDVEQIQERRSLFTIARSNFSPQEIDALRLLPSSDLVDRFFDYWTLKEAYLKARGTGLTLPLNQFSILISLGQQIGIRFMPGMADDSQRWRFMKSAPSARHRLAVADGSGVAGGLAVIVQPWPVPRSQRGDTRFSPPGR